MIRFLKYHWMGAVGMFLLLLATAPVWVFAEDATDNLDTKTPLENWYYLVGVFVPVVTAALIKQNWSQGAKSAAMFVVAAVSALVGSYLRGELDNFDYSATSVLAVATLAYTSYKTLWQAVPLPQRIDAISGGPDFKFLNPYNREKVVDVSTQAMVEQVKEVPK